MTSYAEIFNLALESIKDPSLAKWPEEDLNNELYGWLMRAIRRIPQIRSETSERDAFDPSSVDSIGFANDLSDIAKEVLAIEMHRAWLAPQILSITNTLPRMSKKEGYSQKEFLEGLEALDEKLKTERQKLLRDDTYVDNEYFD